jgi:hypothetical protein
MAQAGARTAACQAIMPWAVATMRSARKPSVVWLNFSLQPPSRALRDATRTRERGVDASHENRECVGFVTSAMPLRATAGVVGMRHPPSLGIVARR